MAILFLGVDIHATMYIINIIKVGRYYIAVLTAQSIVPFFTVVQR